MDRRTMLHMPVRKSLQIMFVKSTGEWVVIDRTTVVFRTDSKVKAAEWIKVNRR